MANPNNPHGLLWLGICFGGGQGHLGHLSKAASFASAIFRGDAVYRVAGGNLQNDITPGTTLLTGVTLNYGAASTLTDHAVMESPDAIYECQTLATMAAASMGKNANLSTSVAGNAVTKMSGMTIDDGTVATTATLDLHLIQSYQTLDNAYGAYARIEVMINKSRLSWGVAGV